MISQTTEYHHQSGYGEQPEEANNAYVSLNKTKENGIMTRNCFYYQSEDVSPVFAGVTFHVRADHKSYEG